MTDDNYHLTLNGPSLFSLLVIIEGYILTLQPDNPFTPHMKEVCEMLKKDIVKATHGESGRK